MNHISGREIAQIEQWHNYGGLTAQWLLKVCNFGYYDKIFDKYKIGYDAEGHAANLRLMIQLFIKFSSTNTTPPRVMIQKLKKFCEN